MLVDLCGIDYFDYGSDEWDTEVSSDGLSRGVEGRGPGRVKYGERPSRQVAQPESTDITPLPQRRFAAVVQLLSFDPNPLGRAPFGERVCRSVYFPMVAVSLTNTHTFT